MKKKSVTLVELILASILLSVVVLSAVSIDMTARYFFRSSDQKVQVLNDVGFLAEHMQTTISHAHGWQADNGYNLAQPTSSWLRIRLDGGTPATFGDAADTWVEYRFNNANNQVTYCSNWNGGCSVAVQTLSNRIRRMEFSLTASNTGVLLNIGAIFDPSKDANPKINPEVNFTTSVFFGEHSF